ncbi:MAG: enoyl-CoA hydratase-related protein [Saprospiraceae bacterium]|nr:enoyl-CoA hydratase-related protein [Saprospiraceae bacterium]
MDPVKCEIKDGLASITLNRPKVYNSINRAMALELQTVLKECAEDDTVRVVLITGAGKAFCAGQDLNEVTAGHGPSIIDIVSTHYNPIVRGIIRMEKPVVAAINGVAAGAGLNLALCCDLVIAKQGVRLIQGFGKIGLIPDSGGTFTLPRLIGLQRSKALMFLNDFIMAEEAEQIGLIYQAVPEKEFGKAVKELCERLSQMATRAIGLTKRALNHSLKNDLDTQLGIEEQLQATASQTQDCQEGIQAFLEKRQAKFLGQ